MLAAALLSAGCGQGADPGADARLSAEQAEIRRQTEAAARAETDRVLKEVQAAVLVKRLQSLEVEVAELRRDLGALRVEVIAPENAAGESGTSAAAAAPRKPS